MPLSAVLDILPLCCSLPFLHRVLGLSQKENDLHSGLWGMIIWTFQSVDEEIWTDQ